MELYEPSSLRTADENEKKPTESTLPKTWGRYNNGSDTFVIAGVSLVIVFCPLMVLFFWSACTHYQCSLFLSFSALLESPVEYFLGYKFLPRFSVAACQIYFLWVLFQAALYQFLPSKLSFGQRTPGGLILPYKTNGLLAYVVTHVLFVTGSFGLGLFPATVIYDNWGGLLIVSNIKGFALASFAFVKAHWFPSHHIDCKFSGSKIYDFFMGVELNPRFGELWDFKLFYNGRPGIAAWTLINISFAAAQYSIHGFVSNGMILVNILQAFYVTDFFINESWYLRTIDISHDHFGFYLAWGDSVWLPFMYTLQVQYLVRHPVHFSTLGFCCILSVGLIGYWIFRSANHQKDHFRATKGTCSIWGDKARYITAQFASTDGVQHESLLLTSGFWGMARHFNYVGDLMLSLAMCLACGAGHLLPYLYILFMIVLLVHRIERDNARCKGKYGVFWDNYCLQVPYKLIPRIY